MDQDQTSHENQKSRPSSEALNFSKTAASSYAIFPSTSSDPPDSAFLNFSSGTYQSWLCDYVDWQYNPSYVILDSGMH